MMKQPFGQNNYLLKAMELQQARLESMTMNFVDVGQLNQSIYRAADDEEIKIEDMDRQWATL